MKNTFLKKAGAVALAAVMAVTFAPVASLNVFAANVGVDKNNKINTDGAVVIEKNGSYTVSEGAVVSRITISGSATNVTIDLTGIGNEPDFAIDSTAASKSLDVTIKGSIEKTDRVTGATVDKIKLDVNAGTTFGALTFSGNLEVNDDKGVLEGSKNGKLSRAFGSEPVAAVGSDKVATACAVYYVGNAIINTKAGDGDDVYAVNGAVDIAGLKDGHKAVISKDANAGTTINATAEDKKSLVKVDTKYTYNYTYTDANNNTIEGTSVYTDTMFQAGNGGVNGLLGAKAPVANTANINTKSLAVKTNKVTAIVNYDRAITLTENDSNKFNRTMHVDYTDSHDYTFNDTTKLHEGEDGITYFTADPTAYVDNYDGIALIDGTKYVINRDNIAPSYAADGKSDKWGQLEVASTHAAKTLQVLRGTSESGQAVDAKDTLHCGYDVTVSAPKTSTVVLGQKETVGTKYNNFSSIGYVYGANHVEGIATSDFFDGNSAARSNNLVASYIKVPQVAEGVYGIVSDGYTDAKVELGKGVTYFYEQKTSQIGNDRATFVFGSASDAGKALKSVLSGDTIDGTTYFTKAVPGETVYAAKDLKGTFTGVNPAVTVKGEISAVGTQQTSGKYKWVVNEGYASDAVPAYRMYRKTGEHVFTINPDEVTMLENAGWINEGVGFKVNSVASKTGTPIYRVYNRNNGGMHFYTASAAEKDMLLANGWTEGKVVFYGADKATGIPVYRTYNTGSNNGEHNYTTNIAESDMNVKAGWRAEGVAFYVFK